MGFGLHSRELFDDLLALVFPDVCVACGQPDRRLCAECRSLLDPTPTPVSLRDAPPIVSAGPYEGALLPVLHALKERGATRFARDLGPRLRASADAAVGLLALTTSAPPPFSPPAAPLAFIAPPRDRANFVARGYEPLDLLARHAGLRLTRALTVTRARRDQAGLGIDAREINMHGSMRVLRASLDALAGRDVVLVDDIVTTGATLREMHRALRQEGMRVVGAIVLAHTPRRYPSSLPSSFPSSESRL